jgi:hypothetical protein
MGNHQAAAAAIDPKNSIKTSLQPPGRPGGREKILRIMILLNLFIANNVEVGIITETEIPASNHGDFNVKGYHSFLPLSHSELLKTAKYRVVVVVRSALATVAKIRLDIMHPTVQSTWIQVDLVTEISAYSSQQQQQQYTPAKGKVTRFLICCLYREWSDLARESTALSRVRDQLQAAAAEVDNIIFAGDINLDTARRSDMRYGRRCLTHNSHTTTP